MSMQELMEKLEKAETVDEINSVKSEIEVEKAHQDAVAEKAKILDSFKAAQPAPVASTEAKTLGEYAEKHLDLTAMRTGASKSAGTPFGFKAYTDVHTAPAVYAYDRNVVDVQADDDIRALFGQETISGNALVYFQLDETEGAPDEVDEAGAKPQFHVPYTPVTVALQKIAGWFYETDELINDAPFMRSAIENRGLFELKKAENAYLAGELLSTSGIQSVTYPNGADLDADTIFSAMMAVKSATGYDADTILINPADFADLRLAKDGASQYYGGGYFYAPYGNGSLDRQPGIWGMTTIVTSAVTAGEPLVGAFRAGASVVSKAGEGAAIEVHRGDHDDAIYNRVTVVVEERLALAVRIPAAFALVSEASE